MLLCSASRRAGSFLPGRPRLVRWSATPDDPAAPVEVRDALRWLGRNSRPMSDLGKPEVLRPLLDSLTVNLDGSPTAPSVVSRRRKIFNTAVEYAVERRLLPANPIPP